ITRYTNHCHIFQSMQCKEPKSVRSDVCMGRSLDSILSLFFLCFFCLCHSYVAHFLSPRPLPSMRDRWCTNQSNASGERSACQSSGRCACDAVRSLLNFSPAAQLREEGERRVTVEGSVDRSIDQPKNSYP